MLNQLDTATEKGFFLLQKERDELAEITTELQQENAYLKH